MTQEQKVADDMTGGVIRRLELENDDRHKMEQAVISAASAIIDNWDDWDAEAEQEAQLDQDERSWRNVMLTYIASRLWREFGWPTREPNKSFFGE